MFYLKTHKKEGEVIVAICDKEILGKKFKSGKLQMEVNEKFYKGDLVNIENAMNAMRNATIANIIGNKIVDAAIDNKFINPENVLDIDGIKHAQLIVMPNLE